MGVQLTAVATSANYIAVVDLGRVPFTLVMDALENLRAIQLEVADRLRTLLSIYHRIYLKERLLLRHKGVGISLLCTRARLHLLVWHEIWLKRMKILISSLVSFSVISHMDCFSSDLEILQHNKIFWDSDDPSRALLAPIY